MYSSGDDDGRSQLEVRLGVALWVLLGAALYAVSADVPLVRAVVWAMTVGTLMWGPRRWRRRRVVP